jgi:hypothetical protein
MKKIRIRIQNTVGTKQASLSAIIGLNMKQTAIQPYKK